MYMEIASNFNTNSITISIWLSEQPNMIISGMSTYVYANSIKFQCKFNHNITSGYPWSDPIRLNNFSLALSLIGFFYMGSQGELLLSQDRTWDKTFGVALYAKCPKCRSVLSGASDLDQYICFVLGY